MKVERAVGRLANILPIKKSLDSMQHQSAEIYLAVINSFFEKGRAPFNHELEMINQNAGESIKKLAQQDMLTLDDKGHVKGCYPFTMENRVHRISISGYNVQAMCALDALAPSAMFECPSVVLSECEVSKEPVRIELENQNILNPDEVSELHFGINWMAASSCGSCSESLCTEMLFLKDTETALSWLNKEPQNREIFTLAEAIEFSAGFFKPMMQQNKQGEQS